jgi:acyl-CoA dehydrogenase
MAIDQESFDILLSSVQRFVRERLKPAEDAVEEHDEVPADIVEDMKAMGLFGLSIPEEYGGIGLSMSQECRERQGDDYILNGSKRFITNAPRAGAFTLMARTDGPGAGGISAFIVPAGLPGLSLGKPDKKMGQRGTKTCDVVMDNVRVPAANLIGGKPGRGFKTAMKVLDRGRLHISAVACGMAQRILDEAVAYARDRKQFGKRIGDFQLIQAMLADSQAELYAGWSMVQDAALRYDAKGAPSVSDPHVSMLASCCKLFCTEMVGRVADRGVQVHGGSGYINEYPVERFYRDVRLLRLYEGTTQIQQLIIGRELIGRD